MRTNQAFWDASAIVPLCVQEVNSTPARRTLRQYPKPIVWWGTMAETRSAFARALRNGVLTQKNKLLSKKHIDRLNQFWDEVPPDRRLRDLSVTLLDAHPLRTGDAFQLAAALVWCKEKPHSRIFVCFDDRLTTVAEDIGFKVIKV
jgi:predicted nucleic acid-binding protein